MAGSGETRHPRATGAGRRPGSRGGSSTHGMRPGDGIALLADNSAQVFEVYWATQRCGLMLTRGQPPPHPRRGRLHRARLRRQGADRRRQRWARSPQPSAKEVPDVGLRLAYRRTGRRLRRLRRRARGRRRTSRSPRSSRARGCSTRRAPPAGRRACATRSRASRSASQPLEMGMMTAVWGMDEHTVYLSPAPLYHSAPLVLLHEHDAPRRHRRRHGAASTRRARSRAIERYRVTHSQWVPTMFVRMLKLRPRCAPRYDLSSHAGRDPRRRAVPGRGQAQDDRVVGPDHRRVLRRHRRHRAPRSSALADWLAHPGSVGRADARRRSASSTTTATSCPPARSARSSSSAADGPVFEYHKDPEKTRDSRQPEHDGWSTVGDMGYLDDDGYLYLTDRTDVHDRVGRREHLSAGSRERAHRSPDGATTSRCSASPTPRWARRCRPWCSRPTGTTPAPSSNAS